MVADVELEANAIDNEMSNQPSENQSFPYMVAGSCPSVNSCTAASAVEILTLDPIVPNKQHSLEEHFWHVATTPTKRGTRAISKTRVASNRQATLPAHGGWRGT